MHLFRKSSESKSGKKKQSDAWKSLLAEREEIQKALSIKNENCTWSRKGQQVKSVTETSLLNYHQFNREQLQELNPRAALSEKRRSCQITKGGRSKLRHISASAANLNITTSTWTKHIPPSLFPGSVYSFHLKEKNNKGKQFKESL